MGLVLEHQEPVLLLAVHCGGDVDGAGVNLLALVQLGQQATLFQHLGAQSGDVHEGLGPGSGLLLPIDLHTTVQIALVGGLHRLVRELHGVNVGGEGGVAAVVGPVGVHHPHLSDGGVTLLLVPEVGLEELQVIQVHGQAQGGQQLLEPRLVQGGEASHRVHVVGDGVGTYQGVGLVHGGLPALHRVNEVVPDLAEFLPGKGALQNVYLGIGDEGAVHSGHELDALGAGVGPLVKLARQGLHRQDGVSTLRGREGLVIDRVHLGLGEDDGLGLLVDGGVNLVGVVPVEDGDSLQSGDAQLLLQRAAQSLGLHIVARLFHGITAKYTHFLFPPLPLRLVSQRGSTARG